MAIGDWSFPTSGCSCVKFTTYTTRRRFVGTVYVDRFFLSYKFEALNNGYGDGRPNFETLITTEVTPENYGGQSATNGFNTSEKSILLFHGPNPTMAEMAEPGAYVWVQNDSLRDGLWNRESFAPGDSYSITLRQDSVDAGFVRAQLIVTWSSEQTEAALVAFMTADLDDAEGGADPNTSVRSGVVLVGRPSNTGGWIVLDLPAVALLSENGLYNYINSPGTDLNYPDRRITVTPTRIVLGEPIYDGTFVVIGGELGLLIAQRDIVRPIPGVNNPPSTLTRGVVWELGSHHYRSTLSEGCENFAGGCLTPRRFDPPSENGYLAWYEDSLCPT